MQHLIKIRRTETGFSAHSPQLIASGVRGVKDGYGINVFEAIASFYMENAKHFGCLSIHMDMSHEMTRAWVNSNSVSNTKLL